MVGKSTLQPLLAVLRGINKKSFLSELVLEHIRARRLIFDDKNFLPAGSIAYRLVCPRTL